MKHQISNDFMIQEMVDCGDLIPIADGYFEDMGGHILHESNLEYYIESFLKGLTDEEMNDLIKRGSM